VPGDVIERNPLLKIFASLETLGAAERRLADYILDHPRETIDATIERLAERSGASYATISRFCKKLGYDGYKEFKRRLIDEVVSQRTQSNDVGDIDLARGSTPEETISRFVQFSERTLRETEAVLDPEQLVAAARAIAGAVRVMCIGAGTSAVTARYAHTRLFRLGINCTAEPDAVVFNMQAAILKPTDVLFAVSSSGRTRSVVSAAETARQRGATVISLSDYAVSPLNRVAAIGLYTTPRSVQVAPDVELPLLVGHILIIDALFGVLTTLLPADTVGEYSETKHAADRLKL
jgi:RpiR family carbohydrate utilization transcriptional regulator